MESRRLRGLTVASALLVGTLGTESVSANVSGPVATESYIVVLDSAIGDVPAVANGLASAHGGRLGFVYEYAIKGFSVAMPVQAVAALAKNPNVAYIEVDTAGFG